MKFRQLIEYNMKNTFVEKSYTKRVGETIPRPLSKKSKLSIYLDQKCKDLKSLFLLYANMRPTKIWWNQAADHLLLPYIKLLKTQKAVLNYNQFHNILRLFDEIPNFPFTTSETMDGSYL